MRKAQIIARLLEIDSSLERSDLIDMDLAELKEELLERTDRSDLFPNGQDYDSSDEDYF